MGCRHNKGHVLFALFVVLTLVLSPLHGFVGGAAALADEQETRVTPELIEWVLSTGRLSGERDSFTDEDFLKFYDEYKEYLENKDTNGGEEFTGDDAGEGRGGSGDGGYDGGYEEPADWSYDEQEDADPSDSFGGYEFDDDGPDEGLPGDFDAYEPDEDLPGDYEAYEPDEDPPVDFDAYEPDESLPGDYEAYEDLPGDYEAYVEQGEAAQPPEEEPAEDPEAFLEEDVLGDVEAQGGEVSAQYSLMALPENGAYMETGSPIAPQLQVCQILSGENGEPAYMPVALYPEDPNGWTFGGDLAASEIGEYTAAAEKDGVRLTTGWSIEESYLSGVLGEFDVGLLAIEEVNSSHGTALKGYITNTIEPKIGAQNFGTILNNLISPGNKVTIDDLSWPDALDPIVFLSITWAGFKPPIVPGAVSIKPDNNKFMVSLTGNLGSSSSYKYEDNWLSPYAGAIMPPSKDKAELPVSIPYTPQPVTIKYLHSEIVYGQGFPAQGTAAFHEPLVDGTAVTFDMHTDSFSFVNGTPYAISQSFDFDWNAGEGYDGTTNADMGVGDHEKVLTCASKWPNYYEPVKDAKSGQRVSSAEGGTLRIVQCPVKNVWKLTNPAGYPYTGTPYKEVVSLVQEDGSPLPFNHENGDLVAAVQVFRKVNATQWEPYDTITALADPLYIDFTEPGIYGINITLGAQYGGNYKSNALTHEVKILADVMADLNPKSHTYHPNISYYVKDLQNTADKTTPTVTVTNTRDGAPLIPGVDYIVESITGPDPVLHTAGDYIVKVKLLNPAYINGSDTFNLPYKVNPRVIYTDKEPNPEYKVGGDIPKSYDDLVHLVPSDPDGGPVDFGKDYDVEIRDPHGNIINPGDIGEPGNYKVIVTPKNPNNKKDPGKKYEFDFSIVEPGDDTRHNPAPTPTPARPKPGDGSGNPGGPGGSGGPPEDGRNPYGPGVPPKPDDGKGKHPLDDLGRTPDYPLSYLPAGPLEKVQALADWMGNDMLWLTYHESRQEGWTVFEDINVIALIGDAFGSYKVIKAIDVSPYLESSRNFTTDTLVVVPGENGDIMLAAVWDKQAGQTTQNMLLIDTVNAELVTMRKTAGSRWFDLSLNGLFASFLNQEALITINIPRAIVEKDPQNIDTVAFMLNEHLLEYVSDTSATLLNTATFSLYSDSFQWNSYPLAQATNEEVLVRVTEGADRGDRCLRAGNADHTLLQERYLLTPKPEKVGFYRWLQAQFRQSPSMFAGNAN